MGSLEPLKIIPSSSQSPKRDDDVFWKERDAVTLEAAKKSRLARLRQKEGSEREEERKDADKLLESLDDPEFLVEIASNTEGRIKEVFLQRGSSNSYDYALISLLKNRPDISFTMVVSSEEEKKIFFEKMEANRIPASRCNFIVMGVDGDRISVWARDSYVMTKTPDGKTAVMEPAGRVGYSSRDDMDVADSIVATTGEKLISSPLVFDGGDMRATGKYLFVGAITIIENIPEGEVATPENVQKVVEKFEKQFGKEVKVVGFTQVFDPNGGTGEYLAPLRSEVKKAEPVFHLDLYFTPLNDNTIAIADPRLTKEILNKMGSSAFHGEIAELKDASDVKISIKANRSMEEFFASRLIEDLNKFQVATDSLPNQQELDQVAENMRLQGFNVIRIPYFESTTFSADIAPMSYNNGLVENFTENGKQVTQLSLPQYGIKELDEAAISAYQHAGVRVIPIQGFLAGMYTQGALNCVTSEKRE